MVYLLDNLRDSAVFGFGLPGIAAGVILIVTGARLLHRG
jgi:hypothetical protein